MQLSEETPIVRAQNVNSARRYLVCQENLLKMCTDKTDTIGFFQLLSLTKKSYITVHVSSMRVYTLISTCRVNVFFVLCIY